MSTSKDNQEPKGNNANRVLASFFRLKTQVVRVGDGKFAARYKRWYNLSWTYIGINYNWKSFTLKDGYVVVDSEEEACKKIKEKFFEIEVVSNG